MLTEDGKALLQRLQGQLIVSVQAYPGEALRDPQTIARMAQACVAGGAAGLRIQGIADIQMVRSYCQVPVIGLWKDGDSGVVITPTLEHALAVARAGAHIVALDGTRRPRPDGLTLADTIAQLKAQCRVLVMADCGSLPDAEAAVAAGADCVGTTLAGYTGERAKTSAPDLELVAHMRAAALGVPLVAEGRIYTPAQAQAALAAGADMVVVGTAITHPTTITQWFAQALKEER